MIDEQNPQIGQDDSITGKNAILEHHGLLNKTVGEVLAEIDKTTAAYARGMKFEILTQLGLPLIKPEISEVDRRPPGNPGVDLIATRSNGHQIAVQCKFRSDNATIVFKEIAGFVAAAVGYDEKWLICNRANITQQAENARIKIILQLLICKNIVE